MDGPATTEDADYNGKGTNRTKSGEGAESGTENPALSDNKDMRGGSEHTQISKSGSNPGLSQPSATAAGANRSVTKFITPLKLTLNKKVTMSKVEVNTITKLMEEDAKPSIRTENHGPQTQTTVAPPTRERGQTGDNAAGTPPDPDNRTVERSQKFSLPESANVAMIADHAK
jgi:hypothetical protein